MHYTTLVTPEILARHLNDDNWRIIDCRFTLTNPSDGYEAYLQGHIPGAHYAHLDEALSSPLYAGSGRHPLPQRESLAQWLGQSGIDLQTQVVVYDDSQGIIAARLWWLLRWLGHQSVALLDGGWQRWQREAYPLSTVLPTAMSRHFLPAKPLEQDISTSTLICKLGSPEQLLIDVRAPERFHGEMEPLDRVAGHIPGAVNLPLQRNLDIQGNFLPAVQLRTFYTTYLATHPIEQVAVMCGSGVTACHTLLALRLAGLGGARLYAGSWSEWIADPQRPVTTG